MKGQEWTSRQLRHEIRSGRWNRPTSGAASGYVQANMVMLPEDLAFEFLLFCTRNHKPCPVLDVLEAGSFSPRIAESADVRTDLPKYRIYRNGVLEKEVEEVSDLFTDDTVTFLLGCSFSFENALLAANVPVRNIEEGKNVSMYITDRKCLPAGAFSSNLVVSMRPMLPEQAVRAVQITTRFHVTHGAPIHMGSPEAIGIDNLDKPDFGDPVTINRGEIPVFWACGVTSTMAAISVKSPLVITHAPGHMFVSDLLDEQMAIF